MHPTGLPLELSQDRPQQKDKMATAYLTTEGMKTEVNGERIDLRIPSDVPGTYSNQHWVPLFDVEHVVLDASIHMSLRSVSKILSRGIPILLLSHGNFPSGIAHPMRRQVMCLANQIDASRNNDFRLRCSKAVVVAKIMNMRRVLQRLSANRQENQTIAQSWLKAMANQAQAAANTDSLRGIEGAASGRYFELIGRYFPDELPFERRSRRPPHNEVNALLSFLYTLLTSEITLHILAASLEPGWGFYHETEDGRPSLALDMLEPFRAPVCDALALDLLNHRRLKAENFEKARGGILLKKESRRIVFAALEERLEREFLYQGDDSRTTLRTIFKRQALQYKRILQEENGVFEPFLMN